MGEIPVTVDALLAAQVGIPGCLFRMNHAPVPAHFSGDCVLLKGMRKSNVTDDELGGLAYETYCKAVGGKSFNGDTLPTWDEMKKAAATDSKKENIVIAWKRAGRAVATLVEKKLPAVPLESASLNDPRKIPTVAIVGSSPPPFAASAAISAMPAPIRNLTVRTKCCGSKTLSLQTGKYVCPCGDHTESI